MRWVDIYQLNGTYVSDVIPTPSNFDYYLPDLKIDFEDNDGEVRFYARVTTNGTDWTDWIDIVNGVPNKMFQNDGFAMDYSAFQYMIELDLGDTINGKSPTVSSIDFDIIGTYNIINNGDRPCKPEIWIKKTNGSGDVKLLNHATGKHMEFTGLNNGETVYIDCENEDIVTDLPMVYRYDSHNDVFLELITGNNPLSGEGDFILSMKLEFKTLQG